MAFYHINPKPLPDGSYEVHQEGCGLLVPDPERIDLGHHDIPGQRAGKSQNLL